MNSHIQPLLQQLNSVLLGKENVVELALTCLVAQGHLLLEDKPGVGKTLLAQSLAQSTGLDYKRVQFTSDLLPSDITGSSIYRKQIEDFSFRAGPLFTQILLADEINRAPSKTQSALLEAMEERSVSVEGQRQALPQPFFVIATQNPLTQIGTFPLPESQLDRFLMRLSLGLPSAQAERQLLSGFAPRSASLNAAISTAQLQSLQTQASSVLLAPALLDYLQKLIAATRSHAELESGLSPRGAIALAQSCRAIALVRGRNFATIEDAQSVFVAVAAHRIKAKNLSANEVIATHILQTTPLA